MTQKSTGIMKVVLIIGLLICFGFTENNSPSLVGTWQINSNIVAASLDASYHFYENKSFVYSLKQSDQLKELISFQGKYNIIGDEIYFTILSESKLYKPQLERGSPGFESGWILYSDSIYKRKIKDKEEKIASIEKDFPKQVIKIDNESFYKISNNPDFGL